MGVPCLRPAPIPRRKPQAALHYLRRRRLVAGSLGATLAARGRAQAPWPQRPVRIVIGFAAGGGVDITARLVGQHLAERLGQSVLIENRPGANGNLATEVTARATDGHTILLGNIGNLAINNELNPRLAFDTLRDFAPVAQVNEAPLFLTIAARLPIRTLDDLVAYARAHPGRLSFASAGTGSAHHLTLELFRRSLGLDIQHVPYRGIAPGIADFIAGTLDGFVDGLNGARPVAEAGFGRILATTGAARAPWLPEVPTIAEAANLPGYEVQSWMALMAPAAMPPEAQLRLQAECEQLLQPGTPLFRALDGQGFVGRFRDGAATRALIEAERARWGRIIREAGITPAD